MATQKIVSLQSKPSWLDVKEPESKVGIKAGTGPTQQMVLKILEIGHQHGHETLLPVQIYAGAKEMFAYKATKEVLKECLKKLVASEFIEQTPDGYKIKR